MGLKHLFIKAEGIINALGPEDLQSLGGICKEIQRAEDKLLQSAEENMRNCIAACEGLCCRNVELDAIIGLSDLIYLLTVENSLRDNILQCLEKENPLFSSDCIFLDDGKGPCIFPPNCRPETCIITFCSDETAIKKEIKLVKLKFIKLGWFILLRKPRALTRSLLNSYNKMDSSNGMPTEKVALTTGKVLKDSGTVK